MALDVMRGFQVGQQIAGTSSFGTFAAQLAKRKLEMDKAQQEANVTAGVLKQFSGGQGGFVPTGVNVGGVTLSNPIMEANQKKAQAEATNQAEVLDAAKVGIRTISQIRGLLQVDPDNQVVKNRKALTRSGIPGAFLSQENPDERDLRSLQGNMHNQVAFVRTGRQGLEQAVPFVAEQFNLGYTDPDPTIIERLRQAEAELVNKAGLTPEEVEQLRQEGLQQEFQRRGIQF